MGKKRLIVLALVVKSLCTPIVIKAQNTTNQKDLPEIIVRSAKTGYKDLGDTIVFDTKYFNGREMVKVKDLLKKMPGFEVDPNGKVYFNGSQINSLMINGDDLLGEHYETIVRNLQSAIIVKVELIKNHSTNRLLKNKISSNSPALNLVISQEKSLSTNNQFNVGVSTNRFNKDMDWNGISLFKRYKILHFADKNQTGRALATNLSAEEIGDLLKNKYVFPNEYFTVKKVLPFLKENQRRNNDKGVDLVQSFKIIKNVSLKIKSSFNNEKEYLKSQVLRQFSLSDSIKWKENIYQKSSNDIITKMIGFDIKFDNSKNHVSNYAIGFYHLKTGINQIECVENINKEQINDRYIQQRSLISSTQNETFRISKNHLITIDNRFFYSSSGNNHQIERNLEKANNDIIFIGKNSKSISSVRQYVFESEIGFHKQRYKSNQLIGLFYKTDSYMQSNIYSWQNMKSDIFDINQFSNVNRSNLYINYDASRYINKKVSLITYASFGYGMMTIKERASKNAIIGSVKANLNILQSAFKKTAITAHITKRMSDSRFYFSSPVLIDRLNIARGAELISFPLFMGFNISRYYMDINRGVLLTLAYSLDKSFKQLTPDVHQQYFYFTSGYLPGSPISTNMMNMRYQQTIFSMKIKPFIQYQIQKMNQNMRMNDEKYFSNMTNNEIQIGIVSYWQSMFNMEATFRKQFISINTCYLAEKSLKQSSNHTMEMIMKYEFSESLFAKLSWNIFKYDRSNIYNNLMHAYVEIPFSKKIMICGKLQNLFNSKYFIDQNIDEYLFQEIRYDLIPRNLLISLRLTL